MLLLVTNHNQSLPESLPGLLNQKVDLVWWQVALPIFTVRGDHTKSAKWSACADAYQTLPNITRGSIWLYPAREATLPTGAPPAVIDDM